MIIFRHKNIYLILKKVYIEVKQQFFLLTKAIMVKRKTRFIVIPTAQCEGRIVYVEGLKKNIAKLTSKPSVNQKTLGYQSNL